MIGIAHGDGLRRMEDHATVRQRVVELNPRPRRPRREGECRAVRHVKTRVVHAGSKRVTQAPVVETSVQIAENDRGLRTGCDGAHRPHTIRPFPASAHRRFRVCGGERDLPFCLVCTVVRVHIDGDGGNIRRVDIQERRDTPDRLIARPDRVESAIVAGMLRALLTVGQ